LAFPAFAMDAPPPLTSLCGIAPAIDQLLGCPAAGAQRTSAAKQAPSPARYVSNRLLVKFKRRARPQEITAALRAAGVTVKRTIPRLGLRVLAVQPDKRDQALAYLRRTNVVARAEKDVVYERLETTPDDAYWSEQWGLRKIRLPEAWDRTHGSTNVVVSVLDTGVDGTHPDLAGVVMPAGHDFVNDDGDTADDEGHGTAVAGVIAARTNNREGQAGVCWTCTVLPEKVLGASGVGDTVKIALALVRAADAGAQVINMSLGGTGPSQALADAVAYAAGKGAILVAAAGNSGTTEPFFPAAYPEVIAVAATDQNDHLYDWSNYGSWVTVAAPGCDVATTRGGGYGSFCGTSAAAPVVSGLAALALAAAPGATRNDVVQAIERGVVPIGGYVQEGRVDAPQTLAALNVKPPQSTPPPGSAPSAGPQTPTGEVRTTSGFRGTLTPRVQARSFKVNVGSGRVVATLSFRGAKRLALSVLNERGVRITRVGGRSRLRLARTLRHGAYRFVVSGSGLRKARFRLLVSYRAPATSERR
jgi:subtilisin family serine protease